MFMLFHSRIVVLVEGRPITLIFTDVHEMTNISATSIDFAGDFAGQRQSAFPQNHEFACSLFKRCVGLQKTDMGSLSFSYEIYYEAFALLRIDNASFT